MENAENPQKKLRLIHRPPGIRERTVAKYHNRLLSASEAEIATISGPQNFRFRTKGANDQ